MDRRTQRSGQIVIEVFYIVLVVMSFTVVANKMNKAWMKKNQNYQFKKFEFKKKESKNEKIRFIK